MFIYIAISLVIFLAYVYIKIKYPFWSRQPIYHTYDFIRSQSSSPYIIHTQLLPPITRYTSLPDITTIKFTNITAELMAKIIDLLLCNYISSDKVIYTLSQPALYSMMKAHDQSAMVSLYTIKEYIVDTSSNTPTLEVSTSPKYIGCITSAPIIFTFARPFADGTTKIPVYYWDHICMDAKYTEKQLTTRLIQSHEFNQRSETPEIKVSLFKKENSECHGVVPLCNYTSYTYYIRPLTPPPLPEHHIATQIIKENMDLLYDFIGGLTKTTAFEIQGFYCIGSMISQVVSKTLYIYMLCVGREVYGVYIFKDAFTYYENMDNGNTVHLIASVNNCTSTDLFYTGFLHSLRDLMNTKKNKKYEILMMDTTSHSSIIHDYWKNTNSPIFTDANHYYLYNMYYPGMPISDTKCLFIV